MFKARMSIIVTEKKSKKKSDPLPIMEMKYKIKDNVLWVKDHRGTIFDFDLDEFDVEIKTIE